LKLMQDFCTINSEKADRDRGEHIIALWVSKRKKYFSSRKRNSVQNSKSL
jgi:hypothetical protein